MIREVTLEEISDGKLYGPNDMVKAGCDDCKGCSACCHGMGSSIVLDPLDMHRLVKGLGIVPEQFLSQYLELNVVDGVILPNIPMKGEGESCIFLNKEGRCMVHTYRPGICRLFPLGRYYEEDGFRYFLQVHECKKESRTKVKVKKWIDTPDVNTYEQYILDWHSYLKRLQNKLNEENAREISMYVLKTFFLASYASGGNFYDEFYKRLRG